MPRRVPWRERERPSLWRSPRWHGVVVVFAGTACLATVQGAIAVVTGGRTPARDSGFGAVVYTVVALAVAVPLTWLVWAYVRRPVEGGDHGADPEQARADRVRDDAERTAWRSR